MTANHERGVTWTPDLEVTLHEWLKDRGQDTCPNCGRMLTHDDVGCFGRSTEDGTEFTMIEVVCSACETDVIPRFGSWYPNPRSAEEILSLLCDDAPERAGGQT